MDTLIKPSVRGTLVALCAANFLGLSACAYQPVGLSELSSPAKTGVAYFELECDDPELLTVEVDYEITGAAIPRIRGVMTPIAGTRKVSATVSLPTGADYTVLLSAIVDEGETDCRASGMFDILDEQSTTLELTLQCDELGSVGQDAGPPVPPDAGPPVPLDAGPPVLPDAGNQSDPADCGPVAESSGSGAIRTGSAVVLLEQPVIKDSAPPAPDAVAREAAVTAPLRETCAVCSQRVCGEPRGSRLWSDCYQSTDLVEAGASAGKSKAQACSDVVTCAHDTGCSSVNTDACYCGETVSAASCLSDGPSGPCRLPWEKAGETTKANDLLQENVFWQDTALGLAVRLLACEASSCAEACAAK